jgi:hypothetical protein
MSVVALAGMMHLADKLELLWLVLAQTYSLPNFYPAMPRVTVGRGGLGSPPSELLPQSPPQTGSYIGSQTPASFLIGRTFHG